MAYLSYLQSIFGKKLFRNAFFNSSSFLVISIINFVTLPFFVSKLGMDKYGIYILVTSLFGYYGIFDLGLGQGLIKFVSERIVVNKEKEIVDGVLSAFWIQAIIGILVSLLLYVGSTKISILLNVGDKYLSQTSEIIKVASIGFFFSMISSTFSSVLMGMQLYSITSKIDTISNALLNIFSLSLLYINNKYGLYEIVLLSVFTSALTMLIYILIVKRKLPLLIIKLNINLQLLKIFFTFSIHIFLSKISNVFANYVVKFTISYFLGPIAVTYYTVPSKLLGALGGILSSASNTLMPYVSALKSELKHEKIIDTFINTSFIFSAVAVPVLLLFAVFANPIIELWMGKDFSYHSWFILTIICASSIIGSFSAIPNQVVMGMGNSKLIGFFSILTVISYTIFLPLLTKYFMLTGAALGLLVTSSLVIVTVIKKTTSFLNVSTEHYINNVLKIHFLPLTFFIALGIAVLSISTLSALVKLIIGFLAMTIYYFYLFYSRKGLFLNMLR